MHEFTDDELSQHEATIRRDQIEKDVQIARDASHDEPGTEWGEGWEQARYIIERRLRAQIGDTNEQ